ncbi:MAG: Eco57I restriction-modification methylase domain-containing protein, partial [Acidimicrobiia bacterium]
LGDAASPPAGEYGEVFTRRWVVELILDLAGYTADRDLASMVAVEPSCGSGAFVGPMVDRLIQSCENHGRSIEDASEAMRAFDLLEVNAEIARKAVAVQLGESGLSSEAAEGLASRWVTADDFLRTPHAEQSVDFVLGNPPYIRLENVPADRNEAYRQACPTMRGRSDIFVGFIEMGLRLLRPDGVLGFIVADRWMRNQYGTALRGFIAEQFAVDAVIEMHDVDAFEDEVSAYPAITVIRRSEQAAPIVASATAAFGAPQADDLKRWTNSPKREGLDLPSIRAARLPAWFSGTDAWPSAPPEQLAVIADLERRFGPLEDPGTRTRVGIGLATGADDVYLTHDSSLVESERLLPMVMAKDLAGGRISWAGHYLVNPWDDEGLVDIDDWPRFRAFLELHGRRVKGRHTAAKAPERWWRTIDRMTPGLLGTPKLLLPEMKASAHPVLDDGQFYPHHNLYYVTSSGWDLEVLGGLMLSDVTNLFIGAYCVKMRGGTYRFQAQYLRRIRVPAPESVRAADRKALASAFERRDVEAATGVAARVYGIDASVLATERRAEVV